MKRCKRCCMTDTRPGIKFNEDGVCYPCLEFERQKTIDWDARMNELKKLCSKYRDPTKKYDCVITISGGKDSHFQCYLFKKQLQMNPLGIMVDNTSWTKTGRDNFNNLSERFDMDILTFTPSRKMIKEATLRDFEEACHPNNVWDIILYREPLRIAQKLGIKLVIWGENTSITAGGPRYEESPNAKLLMQDPEEFPDLEVIFTSYYVPWSRFQNVRIAQKYGFQTIENEWNRWGREDFPYEQVDTIGYEVNQYCKFIKFGMQGPTEIYSDMVRHGLISRKEAVKKAEENDWKLDIKMEKDFCQGIGITRKYFWEIIDKFANRDILEKRDGWWKLKNTES